MALLSVPSEVGLRLLLCPLGSNIVTRTACCAVGIGLPIYSTFKAIENKNRNEQEKWLLYWTVYGSFCLVERVSDKVISWCPFYYHLKFACLVWLQFPDGHGSKYLYGRYLQPFLRKHQATFDQLLNFVTHEIEKFNSKHQEEFQMAKAVVLRCATTANKFLKDTSHPVLPRERNTTGAPNAETSLQPRDSGPETDSDGEN